MRDTVNVSDSSADCQSVHIAFFRNSRTASGKAERVTWDKLRAVVLRPRRQGPKVGRSFVPARLKSQGNGQVRRRRPDVEARTMIVLDVERNKVTGELPPSVQEAVRRIEAMGWEALVYTSHSHTEAEPRYRVMLRLDREIPYPHLPVVELAAEYLDLAGVIDRSKVGPASLFYLPSGEGDLTHHTAVAVDGTPLSAGWVMQLSAMRLTWTQAAQAEVRAEAMAAAVLRREARVARGEDPDDSLIEKIRGHLDPREVLQEHGYQPVGDVFLYPGSQTGVAGVHILLGDDAVERVTAITREIPWRPTTCRTGVA